MAGSTPYRFLKSGVDGSRTRVQKPIPCPSTIIVRYLGELISPVPSFGWKRTAFRIWQPLIRPCARSATHVVSHIVDARILKCECSRADSCHQAAYAKFSSAFSLILPFNALHTDSFSSCKTPVETFTTPYSILQTNYSNQKFNSQHMHCKFH